MHVATTTSIFISKFLRQYRAKFEMDSINIAANFLGKYVNVFAVLGAAAASCFVLKFVCSFLHGFKVYVLSPTLGLGTNLKALGSWAVVTGATDGIGKGYAFQLAKKGLNVVLISRSPEKLNDVAKEIESLYQVKTKCIAVDFSGGDDIYQKVAAELVGIDIGVLVNNVGLSYNIPLFLTEVTDEQMIRNIIRVNCNSVTFMSKLVLPAMVEKRKGVIINISSASGAKTSPLLTVYSATKAFVDRFSAGLRAEYAAKGITIQVVAPFFVATKMSKIRTSSFFIPSPDHYASAALSTVGLTAFTHGCLAHAIQGYVVSRLPEWLYIRIGLYLMLGVRARGLKKLQKKE